MEKGAAFGIQRGYLERPKKRHASDNNDAGNSMIVWDDKVKLALDSVSPTASDGLRSSPAFGLGISRSLTLLVVEEFQTGYNIVLRRS